jgi:hypothetical protein
MSSPAACSSSRTTALVSVMVLIAISCMAQDVLTYHNNNARTGLNNKETILTTSNVNAATFGKLFTVPADGLVDAEPLDLSAVSVGGTTHNVLIVASEHGTVDAYDADTGANLWHITTLKSGETTSDNRGCSQVTPEIGVTATPVILRPKTGNPVIFVVAMSKDRSGNYHQRLHALDATTGAEVRGGPIDIAATYPGTGDNSAGGKVIFDPAQYKERAGLLLVGNTLYLAWASHCDFRPYTGWIMGYNATTLKQTTVLNLTPNGNEGAIWNSGAGMAADGNGNIILLDANGVFDTTLTASGLPIDSDYGNAFLRLTTKGGLAVADYFEMDNEASENGNDVDLGSGGTLLVTQKDSTGKVWQLAIGAGKDSNLYVVDRTNMGKFSPSANKVYQELAGALPGGVWSMPAFFNGLVYYGPVGSPLLAFQFKNAKLLPSPVAKSANSFGYPGVTPSISSNGGKNVIVWAMENSNPGVLHAYAAGTLLELYNSNQAANGRDHPGAGDKFMTPMIANGKVYVATPTGVAAFGLLQ